MTKGYIHKIESFGLVDGPGRRFIVFVKGCAMRCRYCHNPDTWKMEGEQRTPQDIMTQALRYRNYWGEKGGITVSGGEPLLQMDFVTELFELAHEKGVNTCLDTSGQPYDPDNAEWMARFERLMAATDLVMLDIKEIDSDLHKALTGHGNENILAMARWLSDHGKHMWIRHVLVPGLTDDEERLIKTRDFIRSLKGVDRVENLPYHSLGEVKYNNMGIPYTLSGVPAPTKAQKARADELLEVDLYQDYMK